MRISLTSFSYLNFTQFFTALNDNLFKLLLAFFLISLLGAEHSNTILALAGAVFVVPFIIFASLAGTLADRFSKRSIIYFTRFFEIVSTLLGVLAFLLQSPVLGYSVLFLMAAQSTLFSPCKYGIIPEIVKPDRISDCNGMMTATTYLAIIFGTFFASFLTEVTNKNFVLSSFTCVAIAVLGLISSFGIQKTKPQAASKKISPHFLSVIFQTLKQARKRRYLLTTIVSGAYFLFMGAYTQLNIIPFTLQSLGLSEIHGGYLFLMTAIGIGIGSFGVGKLSGKEVELGFVPIAAMGVTSCYLALYFFQSHLIVIAFFLVLVGICGGFFIVPIEAFIQIASPDVDRGQNVAAANFLSFIGVIIASGLLALLGNFFHLSAATGFFLVGVLTFVMAFVLLLLFADQFLRLGVALIAKLFYRIRVWGKTRIPTKKPVLLVTPRANWIDTLIVMATLPRLIRYIVPLKKGKKRKIIYRLLWLIPIDIEHFSPVGTTALKTIQKELNSGHSVCLMHPVDLPTKTLKEWEAHLYELLQDIDVPILPIHISHPTPPPKMSLWTQLKTLRKEPIKVSYGSTR
ncbi:MAG: Lysophospholipid transporter LplT [Chlamydiae bacterium]|nr:Lysophospholipid transporter LplT [Chlamydiota bacterium]